MKISEFKTIFKSRDATLLIVPAALFSLLILSWIRGFYIVGNISGFTNDIEFIKYFVLLSLVAGVCFSDWFMTRAFGTFMAFTSFIFGVFWIAKNQQILSAVIVDQWHEGEYWSYLPGWRAFTPFFPNNFPVHGFGVDVLPSLLADLFGRVDHVIQTARTFRYAMGVLSWLTSFWIFWELTGLTKLKFQARSVLLASSVLLFLSLEGYSYSLLSGPQDPPARQTCFLLLCASFLRLINGDLRSRAGLALLGLFSSLGIVYSYSYGATFVATVAVFLVMIDIWRGSKTILIFLIGMAFGAGLLCLLWGAGNFRCMINQVVLLAKFGKNAQSGSPIALRLFILSGGILFFSFVTLINHLRGGGVRRTTLAIVFLSLLFLFHMDYGMHAMEHYLWVGHVFTFLGMAIIISWMETLYEESNHFWLVLRGLTLFSLFSISSSPLISGIEFKTPITTAKLVISSWDFSDHELIPEDMKAELGSVDSIAHQGACIQATGERISFYLLLNMPSCSRFYSERVAVWFEKTDQFWSDLKDKSPALIISDPNQVFLAPYKGFLEENYTTDIVSPYGRYWVRKDLQAKVPKLEEIGH